MKKVEKNLRNPLDKKTNICIIISVRYGGQI